MCQCNTMIIFCSCDYILSSPFITCWVLYSLHYLDFTSGGVSSQFEISRDPCKFCCWWWGKGSLHSNTLHIPHFLGYFWVKFNKIISRPRAQVLCHLTIIITALNNSMGLSVLGSTRFSVSGDPQTYLNWKYFKSIFIFHIQNVKCTK